MTSRKTNKVVVIYPGRFQPFHKGHKAAYDWLNSKYSDVYIATSDKVDPPRSPFSFIEKKKMMDLTGMDTSKVVQTKSPYQALEITQNFDAENTILIFAISEKDMAEDPRFKFGTKKDGSPSYFQPYQPKGNPPQTMDKHGYITTVPTFNFKVLGSPVKSATEIRSKFAKIDKKGKQRLVLDLFGNYSDEVLAMMSSKVTEGLTEADNFTADEINTLSVMKDLGAAKERALAMVTANKGGRPMKIEKQRWFRNRIDRTKSVYQLTKMLYDMLLSGEGLAVKGSKHSTQKNYYHELFDDAIEEGGWTDTVTQQTKLTPAIVQAALTQLKQFTNEFNRYLEKTTNGEVGPVKMGSPTGSSAYHAVDVADKEYGDIDIQMIAPDNDELTANQLAGVYNKLIDKFIQDTNSAVIYDTGKPTHGHPIFHVGENKVQIDLMWTGKKLSDWARWRVTPQQGIKGLIHGNMFSSLGEILKMSIQHAGVQMKTVDGMPVPFTSRKDITLNTLSTDIENFGMDMLKAAYQGVHGSLDGMKVAIGLKNYPGLKKDDIKISDLAEMVKGLAQSFTANDLYGKYILQDFGSEQEFLDAYWNRISVKAGESSNSPKFAKASTAAELAKVKDIQGQIAKGLALVKKSLRENRMKSRKIGSFRKGSQHIGLYEAKGKILLVDEKSQRVQESTENVHRTTRLLQAKGWIMEAPGDLEQTILTFKNAAGKVWTLLTNPATGDATVRDDRGGEKEFPGHGQEKITQLLQSKGFQKIAGGPDAFGADELSMEPKAGEQEPGQTGMHGKMLNASARRPAQARIRSHKLKY